MSRFSDPVWQGAIPAKQVADRLHVNVETVRRWVRDGQLKAIRWGRGGGIYVRPAVLDAFLRRRGL